ncbi:MAG: 3-isopropylmalate dehydratase small subunit [Pyrinomonadaceae bacterium]
MQNFVKHTGLAVPLYRSNIDTDQIIPKQFLKRIERTGYGEFLFHDWRFDASGQKVDGFVFNKPQFNGASILIAGPNFGCGSSREHAPWSLLDFGIRVVIAPSFADIFYSNSLKNGLLPVVLGEPESRGLAENAQRTQDYQLTIDLENLSVTDERDFIGEFSMDDFRRHCLLNGLDDIDLTLQHESKLTGYEEKAAAAGRFPFGKSNAEI